MLEIAPAVDGGVAARPRRRSRSHCMVFGVPTVAELREAERRFLADNFDLGFAGGLLHRGRGDGLRLLFDYIREFQAQVAGICGKGHASLQINDARAKQLIEFAIKVRSEEHTSELQSLAYLVCRLLLEKKKK